MEDDIRECDNHEASYYKKLTIPNILTVFRMISSVALCGYIASFGITSPLLITLATIGIGATDAIDGYLARNCGMASQLGSILDPVADKVFNWGIGITLMATGIMPLWPLLIAARDVSVFAFNSYQFKKNGRELLPTIPAKLKMLFQSAGVVSTLAFGFGTTGLSLIAPICMGAAIGTVIPEVICIKKKYFSKESIKKEQEESIEEKAVVEEKEEKVVIEKNKTLEYENPTMSNVQSKPKVMKKSLWSNSSFRDNKK